MGKIWSEFKYFTKDRSEWRKLTGMSEPVLHKKLGERGDSHDVARFPKV